MVQCFYQHGVTHVKTLFVVSSDDQVQFAESSGMNFSSIPPGNENRNTANTYIPSRNLDFPSWDTISVNNPAGYQSLHFQPSGQSGANNLMHEQGNTTMGQIFLNDFKRQEHENHVDGLGNWQVSNTKELILCIIILQCPFHAHHIVIYSRERRRGSSLLAPAHVF